MNLTGDQIERYSRHIILPEVGGNGQVRMLAGKVLLVGAGGLGSPAGLYLAAAGVGTIGVIFDVFNLFNTNATLNEGELTGFNYGDPIAVMRPRLARIGVRYMW